MTVAIVRLLIADPLRYDRFAATGNGVQTVFELPHSPLAAATYAISVAGVPLVEGVGYTLDQAVGVIMFTAAPALGAAVEATYKFSVLTDANLTDLLVLESNSDKLAAAQALDIIASNEVLVQKRIRLLDLSTDGPAEAEALRAHARALREEAEAAAIATIGFEIAEMVLDDATYRERLENEALRDA